jgi:hypothetical protein
MDKPAASREQSCALDRRRASNAMLLSMTYLLINGLQHKRIAIRFAYSDCPNCASASGAANRANPKHRAVITRFDRSMRSSVEVVFQLNRYAAGMTHNRRFRFPMVVLAEESGRRITRSGEILKKISVWRGDGDGRPRPAPTAAGARLGRRYFRANVS